MEARGERGEISEKLSENYDDDIYVMDGEVQKGRGCCGQWAECIEVHASPLCTRHRDDQWRAAPPACNAPPRRQPSPRLKHHHVT
ncbi:unnamed protein product [Euphydryas editha]|uniref:Uncharacterized protein n=1 Tax=Euphydryas editha TaxID=104508 RepID=A0AAU9UW25_EUPED|nr:unnamed protein product [Euphydryas editha]